MIARMTAEESAFRLKEKLSTGKASIYDLAHDLKWTYGKTNAVVNAMITRGELQFKIKMINGRATKVVSLFPFKDDDDDRKELTGKYKDYMIAMNILSTISKMSYDDVKDYLEPILATAFGMPLDEFRKLLPDKVKKGMLMGITMIDVALKNMNYQNGMKDAGVQRILGGLNDE